VNGEAFSAEIIMRQALAPRTALAERSSAPVGNPYQILDPIKIIRRELGLTSNDLVTLHALISFLPKKHGQLSTQMTVVFPSNAALSERTNGLDERTIRRCISRLVGAGLILRRDSATRKRFPLRYGGEIKDAFGFELGPMFEQEEALKARAQKTQEKAEHLRSVRAQALALRVEALKQARNEAAISFLQNVRNILRRATIKIEDIMDLIKQMSAMFDVKPPRQEFPAGNLDTKPTLTDKMSATDGQNVRHVEAKRLNIKKEERHNSDKNTDVQKVRDLNSMAWEDFKNLSAFFPTEPRDMHSTARIIADTGALLCLNNTRLMRHLRTQGPAKLLLALDTIIGKAEEIRHPSSYLDTMMDSTL